MGRIYRLPPDDLSSWYCVELESRDREYGSYSQMTKWLEEHAEGDCYIHNSGSYAVSFREESDRMMFALTWVKR
jgi:hypothetical protein